ncbi:MAG: response regulator [Magnetococcales bacterium]|nr:response regulator [Magnetococcales bacterium]
MSEILVIDDEPRLLNLLKRVLEEAGYSVATAENGRMGLQVFNEVQPKLIITDILMPEMDGIDVIRTFLEDHKSVKIIAISGGSRHLSADFTLQMAHSFGVEKTLFKPFSNQEILSAVEASIGQPGKPTSK